MKKLVILLLAVMVTACSSAPAAAPTEPPALAANEPTPTPVVIVQTVVVEATQVPTEAPPPTAVPPTAAPVVITVVVEPTQQVPAAQAPTTAPVDTSGGLVTIDNNLGAGWFTDITLNRNSLALRCQLIKDITFRVKPTDPNITQVDFYYRIQDRATGAVFEWQNKGRMIPDANGNFTLVFSGEDVSANFRKPNAWLDFQFVGSNPSGVVGRSEKIEQRVTYTFDCP